MGRPKNFTRQEVLEKAIPIFWERGFADTSIQDLEKATGVNKSGLYSEFESKEELFVESLRHYLSQRNGGMLLNEPLGWDNLRDFLRQSCPAGVQGGCLAVYSIRELSVVPDEALDLVVASREKLKGLISRNIAAAAPHVDATELADVVLTFFTGICLEQNLGKRKAVSLVKIDTLISLLQSECCCKSSC
jgi:AcrR family transcriptional regulator